jgi:hypothetical protein
MIMRRISISLAVFFVCLTLVASVNAEPNFANVYTGNIKRRPLEFVQGRVLVKFKETVADDEAEQIVRGLGARIKRSALRRRAFKVLSVPQGKVWQKIQALSRNPRVEYAHPDWIVHAADFPYDPPNDPRYAPYQWNLHSSAEGGINMESAWAINTGGSQEVVVAVLDTGIAYEDYPANNPTYCRSRDFDGTSFATGYDFINNDSHPNDDNGHGTHVSSTIAETTNNGWDFAGIAYKTTLMPVKILGKDGSGAISTIADGIYYAADHGADIISMSFGTSAPRFFLTALENAVKYAHSNGVLLVAASGNAGADNPMYPAGYSEVISVGATTSSGALASYSNRGNEICAPGGDYYNPVYQYDFTLDSDWYCVFSIQGAYGTSMATPHVSGVAALVLAEDPSLTNEEIRQILRDTADDIGVSACGSRFLNAHAALQSVAIEDDPPTVTITEPVDQSTVSGNVIIRADASDDNGVTQVEFFVDSISIGVGSNNSGEWTISWDSSGVSDGVHTIKATATDTMNQTANNSITVTTDNVIEDDPPTVTITEPVDQSTVSGNVIIRADASDDNGVTQVEFFVDSISIGMGINNSGEWTISWDSSGVSDGVHTIQAVATDTQGQTDSDSITVTVNNTTVDDPPTVTITEPVDQSTVSGNVTIEATATDDFGVDYVTFFVDDTPISVDSDDSNGWSAVWYTTVDDNGSHAITATATDSKGQTDNYSITVTVSNKNIHIGDLDGFSTRLKWDVVWQATVTITVHDHLHNPVQGANVKILWSDGSPDSCLQVTDANGKCTAIGFTWKWKQWLGLTVTNVVYSTLPYEPIGNYDPDGDSDGTEIWIRR